MREIRIVAVGLIIFLLVVLSQSTERFWWFKQVNWTAVWQNHQQGIENSTKAYLWATMHGAVSAIIGMLVGSTLRRDNASETEWVISMFLSCVLGAMLASVGDIRSGWWILSEDDKYIPIAWCAFLQSFLIMFAIALIFTPVPDPIKRSRAKKTSGYIA